MKYIVQRESKILEGSMPPSHETISTSNLFAQTESASVRESFHQVSDSCCDTSSSRSESDSSSVNDDTFPSEKCGSKPIHNDTAQLAFRYHGSKSGQTDVTDANRSARTRRGRWSKEELAYTSAIIQKFKEGLLTIPLNVTLRSYISEKLKCEPTRVAKKYPGERFLGASQSDQHFSDNERSNNDKDQAMMLLDHLENQFLTSMERENKPKYVDNPESSMITSKLISNLSSSGDSIISKDMTDSPPEHQLGLVLANLLELSKTAGQLGPAIAQVVTLLSNSQQNLTENADVQADLLLSRQQQSDLCLLLSQYILNSVSSYNSLVVNSQENGICTNGMVLQNQDGSQLHTRKSADTSITDDLQSSGLEQDHMERAVHFSKRLKDVYQETMSPSKTKSTTVDVGQWKINSGQIGHIVIESENKVISPVCVSYPSARLPEQPGVQQVNECNQNLPQRYLLELRMNYEDAKLGENDKIKFDNDIALSSQDTKASDAYSVRSSGGQETYIETIDKNNKLFYLASIATLAEEDFGNEKGCNATYGESSGEEECRYECNNLPSTYKANDSSENERNSKRMYIESRIPFRKRLRHL